MEKGVKTSGQVLTQFKEILLIKQKTGAKTNNEWHLKNHSEIKFNQTNEKKIAKIKVKQPNMNK